MAAGTVLNYYGSQMFALLSPIILTEPYDFSGNVLQHPMVVVAIARYFLSIPGTMSSRIFQV